jgi:hypothetical protein
LFTVNTENSLLDAVSFSRLVFPAIAVRLPFTQASQLPDLVSLLSFNQLFCMTPKTSRAAEPAVGNAGRFTVVADADFLRSIARLNFDYHFAISQKNRTQPGRSPVAAV